MEIIWESQGQYFETVEKIYRPQYYYNTLCYIIL